MTIYDGIGRPLQENILYLLDGLLHRNYKLYMDNFYNRYLFCNYYNTIQDHTILLTYMKYCIK